MDTLTYWNGTWHEGNPAILGPRDHAFWLGSMVFDGGRAFEGCGPDLDLHAERVVRSACSLGLKPTKTAQEILDLGAAGFGLLMTSGAAGAVIGSFAASTSAPSRPPQNTYVRAPSSTPRSIARIVFWSAYARTLPS